MAFKNILFLLVAVGVVASKAQNPLLEYYSDYSNSTIRPDDFLDANRRNFAANIWYYDLQIETFKELYLARISTLEIQQELLTNSVIQSDQRLYPLTLLSDFSKNCVHKYKSGIPSLAAIKSDMQRCINNGNNQVASLTSAVSSTNRTLQNYYSNNFEKEVTTCKTKFEKVSALNYTLCLNNAVVTANTYTLNNKKTFDSQMDTAKNSADIYVKTAQECGFNVLNNTISLTAKANTLINRCLDGLDDCSRCKGHFCEHVSYLKKYEVSYTNATMRNPFYGRYEAVDCLMLDIY